MEGVTIIADWTIGQYSCVNVTSFRLGYTIVWMWPHSDQAIQLCECDPILIRLYNCVNVTTFLVGGTIVWMWPNSN